VKGKFFFYLNSVKIRKMKINRNTWLCIKHFFCGKTYFPSNFIITSAHGSFKIPSAFHKILDPTYRINPRLLLNFSDYGTKYLIDKVPENQRIIPKYGRLVGDPNRAKDAPDILRFYDFNGNKIFTEKFEQSMTSSWFHSFWLHRVLKLSYYPFYAEVYRTIEKLTLNKENDNKPILLIDIHDTGNLLLGATPSQDKIREDHLKVPKIIISNAPDEEVADGIYSTCPMPIMEIFQKLLTKKLGVPPEEVKINHLFKGGKVTRTFGNPSKNKKLRKILKGKHIYTIQLEFDRGLYMNETTQQPINWRIKSVRSALMESLHELEVKLAENYYD